MGADLNKTFQKVQKINPWGLLSLLLLIVFVFMLGYYGYISFQAKKLTNVIAEKEQTLQQEQLKLTKLKQESSYVRYQAAQLVTTQFYNIDWKQRYQYLITVLNMVRQLDEKTGQAITLSDINVQDDKITLRWEVVSIPTIYAPGGLIDQFVELSFINHITIPYYRKSGEYFEFILDATIQPYDTAWGQI